MRRVELTQGHYTLVDEEDYERVSKFNWQVRRDKTTYYAQRYIRKPTGQYGTQLLHRFILNLDDPDRQADHINHDGLDNRRCNLRIVTQTQNQANRRGNRNASSRFKGVTWHARDKRWQAALRIIGVSFHLGYFKNEVDAARTYDSIAREWFGTHAYLNFPELVDE